MTDRIIPDDEKPGIGTLVIILPFAIFGTIYQAWTLSVVASWYFADVTWAQCVGACSSFFMMAHSLAPKRDLTSAEAIAKAIASPFTTTFMFGMAWLIHVAFGWVMR
jgi:hypothetical protein